MSAEQSNVPPAGQGRPSPGAMPPGGQGGRRPGPAPAGGPGRPGAPPPGAPPRAASGGGGFGRFAIDYLVPFAVGLVVTVALYLLLIKNLPTTGIAGEIRAKLADRGFAPYACTMILFWLVSHLAIRYFVRIRLEFAALKENLVPATGELTGAEAMEMTRRVVAAQARKGKRILTSRLLLAAEHLRLAVVNVELGDLLRHADNADRERIASKRALPTFLFWAIPALGLAGTVGGIGAALGVAAAEEAAVLSAKAASLGAAFDNLLVAVFMTLVALLVQLLVRHSESRLLADVEDYLNRRLQARIRTESIDSRMQDIVGEAIEKLTYLQEGVQKNQGEIMAGNMQTVTGSQEAIRESIKVMPQLLETAGKEAADMIAGTVREQTQVAQQILTNLDAAGKGAANVISGAAREQTQAAQQILTNLDAKATNIAHNLGEEFSKVTADLAQALKEVTGRLAESFQSAKELTDIQAALQRTLEAPERAA